jgi:hypothetical protein
MSRAGGASVTICPERRNELVQIYLHLGLAVSSMECLESGVCATYARVKAGELGLHFPRPKSAPPPIWKTSRTHEDPRWARAISIGAVTA